MQISRNRRISLLCGLVLLVIAVLALHWRRQAYQASLDQKLLSAVARNSTYDVIDLLKQGADANSRLEPTDTRALLSRLFSLKREIPSAPTALLAAMGWLGASDNRITPTLENPEMVNVLLDYGAQIDARDRNGDTPLMIAAITRQHRTFQLLLDRGANFKTADSIGQTCWSISYFLNDLPDMDRLIGKGVNINQQGDGGINALLWSCAQGNVAAVRMLLDHHAAINIEDSAGHTPLAYAKRNHHTQIEKMLEKAGARE